MGRARKKLQKSDINRNSSVEISHTITKIKEHELRYTIILVSIFISIFIFLGYNFLSIDNYEMFDNTINNIKKDYYFSVSSNSITMNNNNIYNDEVGLKSEKKLIHIINNTDIDKRYKIYFKINNDDTFDLNKIKYSLDQKNILTLNNDNLFTEDIIKKGEEKDIIYNIWISDENITLDNNYYLNGYFIVNEENNE